MASREVEVAELPQRSEPTSGPLSDIARRLVDPFRTVSPPEPLPATGFFTDTTVCIGCKACEVACKEWNLLPADGLHWSGNSYDNTGALSATSWRHVKFIEQLGEPTPAASVAAPETPLTSSPAFSLQRLLHEPKDGRWLMMSDVCKHCVAAPCQQACPTGAIIHNEFENVFIQPDICNGCSSCVSACPFGVVTRSSLDGHSHKCTLCYDRQRDGLVPACAKACPTQSIQFGPIDELRERARARVHELHRRGVTEAYLYGDVPTASYSELNSFYLLVDRPAVYGLPDDPVNPWLSMKGDYVRAIGSGLAAIAALLATLWLGAI
jgi:formate dehydrogenase iron-sulfur subunit